MTKELSVDEQLLKRKTRRRLLGAAALTLFVVVALPMLLDDAPRPSDTGISLDIPAADKVSEFTPPPAQTAPPIQSAPVAETPPVSPPPVAAEPPVKTILPVPKPVLVIPPVNPVKRYLIHVGNYSNPVKAAQVIDKLKQNNLKVSTEPSGNLTRIRVGPFTDREQADKARQLLQKQGTHTTLLILTR